jgi:surfactin family lipopeptide synthetase A
MPNDTPLSAAKQKLLELQKRGNVVAPVQPVSNRREPGEPVPLSLSQEQVWRLQQSVGAQSPLYNESITIHRHGVCDVHALEASLAEIIRRHEIWRTTFDLVRDAPVQIVYPAPTTFTLPVNDLRVYPEQEREARALALSTEDAKQPFNLTHAPLLRARLVTLSDTEHRLYLTAHQIVIDGVTVFDVFPSELTALYDQFAGGKPSTLLELPAQFADFACAQRQRFASKELESQLEYWRAQLADGLAPLQWPNPANRPAQQTYRGAIHPFRLSKRLTASLKELSKQEGVTLFMTLLGGLVMLLHRYTRQTDITVGTLSPSGRKYAEFQRLVGYFLNPVPLRAKLSGSPNFQSLLHQMRAVTLGALSNDDVTLELIADRLGLPSDPNRHLFFTVVFSLAPGLPQLPSGWSMTYMDVESGAARWDLYIEMSDRAEGMIGRAQYNPDLFTSAAIAQTVQDFELLLKELAASPVS